MCKHLAISRSKLHRILKKEVGLSLSHYIRQIRIAKGRDLLEGSDQRISEISDAVGINGHQNFTKYFKQEYGLSPRDYRKSIKVRTTKDGYIDRSLVILPFKNLSDDKGQEYFSDGLTDDLILLLGKDPDLKVLGRTTSFAFKRSEEDLQSIGKKLNVNYIIEGSVRKSQDKLRITAHLINASDGYQIWSEKFTCVIKDIFDLQDEMATSIVQGVKNELLDPLQPGLFRNKSRDPIGYEYYLKGLFYLNKYGSTDNFLTAIEYFNQALAIEPDYIECLSELASCYIQLWFFSQVDPELSISRTKALIDRAHQYGRMTASMLVREGHYKTWHEWDMFGAKELLEKAISMRPNSTEAHMHYCLVLTFLHDFDLAESHIVRAISLDPLSPILQFAYSFMLWFKGDFEKGMMIIDKLISFKPRFWGGQYLKGVLLLEMSEPEKALQYGQGAVDLFPSSMTYALLAQANLLSANFDRTKELVSFMENQLNKFPVSNFDLGHLNIGLGEFEKSRAFFQKAMDNKEGRMLFLLPTCRKIKMIHKHPYYRSFFDHMKTVTHQK